MGEVPSDEQKVEYFEMNTLLYPNPELKKVCEPITKIDDIITKFCKDLLLYCRRQNAAGYSAIQVGFNKQIVVVNDTLRDLKDQPKILINPVITNGSGKSRYKEGCFSLPGIYAFVNRFNTFDLSYMDLNGESKTIHIEDTSNNFYGTVVQHEIDHNNGFLFIDRLNNIEMDKISGKINKMRERI